MSHEPVGAILTRVPNDAPNRSMVFVLGGALGVSLLVIAFLLGRESSRTNDEETASASADPLPAAADPDQPSATAGVNLERQWPKWADLDESQAGEAETQSDPSYQPRIETGASGRILLSNRNLDGSSHSPTTAAPSPRQASPATAERPAAGSSNGADVVSYFQRVDAIRSSSAAVDPNAFAMDLIKATMKGSTEGFDELIDDTKRMRAETAAIDAPPECQAYHRESLAALDESQAVLETMKTAIQKGDMQALTRITQQASALQARAETLDALRSQILANARR